MSKETLSLRKRESISRRSLLTLERGASAFFADDTAVINRDETKLTENSKHLRHTSVLPQSFEVTMALGRRPGRWSFPPGHERDPRHFNREESKKMSCIFEGLIGGFNIAGLSVVAESLIGPIFSFLGIGFGVGWFVGRLLRASFYNFDTDLKQLAEVATGLAIASMISYAFWGVIATSPFMLLALGTFGIGVLLGLTTKIIMERIKR